MLAEMSAHAHRPRMRCPANSRTDVPTRTPPGKPAPGPAVREART